MLVGVTKMFSPTNSFAQLETFIWGLDPNMTWLPTSIISIFIFLKFDNIFMILKPYEMQSGTKFDID